MNLIDSEHAVSISEERLIKEKVRVFLRTFKKKWKAASRNKQSFVRSNEQWLENEFKIGEIHSDINNITLTSGSRKRRRKAKDFNKCSIRTKRRKVQRIRSLLPRQLLQAAVKQIVEITGKKKKVTTPKIVKLTGDEALALMVDAKLSRHEYQLIRAILKAKKVYLLPLYSKVLVAKRKCYPKKITVSETKVVVSVQ